MTDQIAGDDDLAGHGTWRGRDLPHDIDEVSDDADDTGGYRPLRSLG